MKRLTEQEFVSRAQAVDKARRIFMDTGLTNNITTAFEMYQEIFAEEERAIFLSKLNLPLAMIDDQKKIHEKYVTPKCPECDTVMGLRDLTMLTGKENVKGYKTVWQCINEDCLHEIFNEEDVLEIRDSLEEVDNG